MEKEITKLKEEIHQIKKQINQTQDGSHKNTLKLFRVFFSYKFWLKT